jgi:hypothetical protein
MPYSYPSDIPLFAKNKKAEIQKRVIALFNETLARTRSENSARAAALAFMKNYEAKYGDATDKRLKKSAETTIEDMVRELLREKHGSE